MSSRIKVAYLASWGRSGSTILSDILGQIPGITAVGEVRFIWERGFIGNQFCGCGQHFAECEQWMQVVADAYGNAAALDAKRWDRDMFRFTRTLQIWRWLRSAGKPSVHSEELRAYLDTVRRLYASILRVTGARLIVDSSKFPMYAGILALIPEIELYLIHLVRDPRAVAHSWSRPKQGRGEFAAETTPFIGPVWSTLRWTGWNRVIEYLGAEVAEHYKLLRYEDFARDPRAAVRSVLEFLGEPDSALPISAEGIAELRPSHTISGNPSRFSLGSVELKPDKRWLTEMPLPNRLIASLLSLPSLKHFGYPLWASAGGA